MLGARARAAEYNAFKAATARQANREAEEQTLPPKSTPVSLVALARNLQPNRNKGNKSYIPLVIEDDSEFDRPGSRLDEEEGKAKISTPSHKLENVSLQHENHESPIRDLSSSRTTLVSGRTSIAGINLSSMGPFTPGDDRSAILINPTPRRVLPHSLINQTQNNIPSSETSTPSHITGISPRSVRPNLQAFSHQRPFSHGPQLPLQRPNNGHTLSAYNYMTPDDISPAKQENKLALLTRIYGNASAEVNQPEPAYSLTPGVNDGAGWAHHSPLHFATAAPPFMIAQEMAVGTPNHHHARDQQVSQIDPFSITCRGTDLRKSTLSTHSGLTRHLSYHDPSTILGEQDNLTDQLSTTDPHFVDSVLLGVPGDEPYDRHSQMQRFVATQQAMAKTGKTVLHNPELHRRQDGDQSRHLVPSNGLGTPFRETCLHGIDESGYDREVQAILKPPPGFGGPDTARPPTANERGSKWTVANEGRHFEDFNVGSEEWFHLKPFTSFQRMNMKRALRSCVSAEGIDAPRSLHSGFRAARLRCEVQRDESASESKRRCYNAIQHLAAEHLQQCLDRDVERDIAEMEAASIRAIGNIMVNIKTCRELESNKGGELDYFNKYKAAPEYAIERSRLLVGNATNSSYFEQDTGRVYNAPSRIARDPRFRPANKEGMKTKSEEDWKLRHDMYGRRRM